MIYLFIGGPLDGNKFNPGNTEQPPTYTIPVITTDGGTPPAKSPITYHKHTILGCYLYATEDYSQTDIMARLILHYRPCVEEVKL